MGQIDSKDSDNSTNDLSDRKGIIGGSRGSTSSSDLNIKIDDNSDGNKESNEENKPKETESDKKLKKAKTYDFACTAFFAMVAMLVFSTVSRTYTSYSGGGCGGALYGAQPLLAYSCVGLACVIIKGLRKIVKEEINGKSDDHGKDDEDAEEEEEVDTNERKPYEVSTLTSKEKLNTEMNFAADPKIGFFPILPERDTLIVNIPLPEVNLDKLSNGLPLPIMPPPTSKSKRNVSFETPLKPNVLSTLSAEDLKVVETDLVKEKNKINETHGSDPLIIKNDWKEIKFETTMFRNRDSHHQTEYNWNDYNLNSIDKY